MKLGGDACCTVRLDNAPVGLFHAARGCNATREGVTLTKPQLKARQVPRLQRVAYVDELDCVASLKESCMYDTG
jgi:hypothetical protein